MIELPPIDELGYPTLMYLLIGYILLMGLLQLHEVKVEGKESKKSYVPLGGMALVLGIIAFIQKIRMAFDAIEAAGDISPQIVAANISGAYAYPTLGLIGLALAYLFKYLKQ